MTSAIQIPAFTVTCLMVTAIVCVVSVFVAWYTVRSRVKFSQIILGAFCYVLVMVLENLLGLLPIHLPDSGFGLSLYTAVSVVLARELIRYPAMELGVRRYFDSADAALGFALGFGGVYLLICGAYYFNCYTAASEFVRDADAFLINAGADSDEALRLLETISSQNGWQFIATGLNRVFYLVREMALCLILWYAMAEQSNRLFLILVPVLHLIAMLPEGLYQGGILASSYIKDGATIVISAAIAFLASRQYNAHEDQVAHFQVEHLRARKRR